MENPSFHIKYRKVKFKYVNVKIQTNITVSVCLKCITSKSVPVGIHDEGTLHFIPVHRLQEYQN